MMKEQIDEYFELNGDDLADFVKERLLADGLVVTDEDVQRVLNYVWEFYLKIGLIEALEEFEGEFSDE